MRRHQNRHIMRHIPLFILMKMMLTRFGFRLKIVVMKPVKTDPSTGNVRWRKRRLRITFIEILWTGQIKELKNVPEIQMNLIKQQNRDSLYC
jgi:hypothetical protein